MSSAMSPYSALMLFSRTAAAPLTSLAAALRGSSKRHPTMFSQPLFFLVRILFGFEMERVGGMV